MPSRLTYFLEFQLNVFLPAFDFECRIEDAKLQVDT